MTIALKPDQEKAIQNAIDAGLVGSVEEFIETAIEALRAAQRHLRAAM